MKFLEFKSCKADPDVWMRPVIKIDRTENCEWVLLCTNDALVTSMNPDDVLRIRNEMCKCFELKEESIGPPNTYLGGHTKKVLTESAMERWSFD